MGRPKKEIDFDQLESLMRLNPTLKDTAAFFKCDEDTICNHIKKATGLRFSEFREQNMVHTRLKLIRTATRKAENGDNVMLIFCLKNLCGWKDKNEISTEGKTNFTLNYQIPDKTPEMSEKEKQIRARLDKSKKRRSK